MDMWVKQRCAQTRKYIQFSTVAVVVLEPNPDFAQHCCAEDPEAEPSTCHLATLHPISPNVNTTF